MLTLRQILNAAWVRAKPLFDNFSLIQAAFNDLQAQFDASLTPPGGSEVTNARDYATVLRNRLRGASKAQGNVIIDGGAVTAQAVPNMTVHIATGSALVDGVYCSWAAADTAAITAPSANPRYDIVVVNSDNTITVITGTEAALPVYPTIASSQRPLYAIPLIVGQTTITTASLIDLRRNTKSNGLYNAIEIYNQDDFEFYFGDGTETGTGLTQGGFVYDKPAAVVNVTVPANAIINFFKCSSGGTIDSTYGIQKYLLSSSTAIYLSNNVHIFGDDEVIISGGSSSIIFNTLSPANTSVSGVTNNFGGDIFSFTVADSSSFSTDDVIVHDADNMIYRIRAITDSTTIRVWSQISGATSGNIYKCVKNINIEKIIIKGRLSLNYCFNGNFDCTITNNSAGVVGGPVYKSNFTNIFACRYPVLGGTYIVSGLHYCKALIDSCDGGNSVVTLCTHSEIEIKNSTGLTDIFDQCDYCNLIARHCHTYGTNPGNDIFGSCDYCTIKGYQCTGGAYTVISCASCESIWIDSGTINSSSLGGIRLVEDTDAAPAGTYSQLTSGGYAN